MNKKWAIVSKCRRNLIIGTDTLTHGAVAKIATKFKCSRLTVCRIYNEYKAKCIKSEILPKFSNCGVKSKLTNELRTTIMDLFHEKEGRGT